MEAIKGLLYRILAVFTSINLLFSGTFSFLPKPVKISEYEQCKNVIFLIGDGMGFNSIEMAEKYLGRELESFDEFTLSGKSDTDSATAHKTDSAAGGTALATGVRVSIGTVGVYPDDIDAKYSHPMNLTELAVSQGKSAGVVTTAKTWDATPAAFSAHAASRDDYKTIHKQQSQSDLTLLWGMGDGKLDLGLMESSGFEIVTNEEEMNALDGSKRSFGQFAGGAWNDETADADGMPTLSDMTEKAIDILDDDADGFFLMVEGAHIDKNSHNMDKKGMSQALDGFDKAIKVALDYAKENGNTLVIVTADHETGGIVKIGSQYVYTVPDHTTADVPLFVYGCNNFIQNGTLIENREIARRVACVMGELNFPIKVMVSR